MRMSKPGSSGSIRVNINGLPHVEHGGRRLLVNLKLRGSVIRSASAFIDGIANQFRTFKLGHCEIQIRPPEG
jgi:hypothetical protein